MVNVIINSMKQFETKTNLKTLSEELKEIDRHDDLANVIIDELIKSGWWCSRKFDLERFRNDLFKMKRHMPLYEVVRDVGKKMGWYQNRPRGNPQKGFEKGFGKNKTR
jgi:hypothetical protein